MEIGLKSYRPFVMGGPTCSYIKCDVSAEGPYDLGGGYQGYLVTAPDGTTYVADAISGGIVGPSLEAVRADIQQGDPEFMVRQVEEAKVGISKATLLSPDEFWALFRPQHVEASNGT